MNPKKIYPILFLLTTTLLTACKNDRPFTYKYNSATQVDIYYQGKKYRLNQYRPNRNVPFHYEFESDGDVDLVIDGREYEIDSPYDKDKKKSSSQAKSKNSDKKNSDKKYVKKNNSNSTNKKATSKSSNSSR